jgi:FKBP-type peptidyl-prolyl cis-trans isomerase FkpA
MRTLLALSLTLAFSVVVLAADPTTDEQKAFYALGVGLSKQLGQLQPVSKEEADFISQGLGDGLLGKPPKADPDAFAPKLKEIAAQRSAKMAEEQKKKGQEFLDKAGKEKGAKKTESGLVYQEITPGTGDSPKATDTVKVNYRGTLIDGTEFDSSYKRNQPATFPLSGVIKCWTEGVQLMKVGGKSKLVCPPEIAYGDRGAPPTIKPGSTLIFEVELLSIEKKS